MNPQLAFVFPGQGSQRVGMLAQLAGTYPMILETFAEASSVLGYDLWKLVQEGPQEQLNLTERTQPLLLTASVAIWRTWQQCGGAVPAWLAGHSLGEFSALVCAGSLEFADGVALVRDRGRFMQEAVSPGQGAMAAILGLDDAQIAAACAAADGVVEAVNFNAPGQVVIAGHAGAVERAIEHCKAAGAKKAMSLPVSAPFHTSLMRPAGERLASVLREVEILPPAIPVVHNVHAQPESDPERIRALLVDQIHSPVRWVECVEFMVAQGAARVVECGPGRVLSGLNKRIDKSLESHALEEPAGLDAALAAA